MSIYVQVVLTLGVIIALIFVYRSSDRNEEFLVLKLIGYYFIGTFRFNFNALAIPLGFIIYSIAIHPKSNLRGKRSAALIGLLVFIVGVFIPKYDNYLFTRPIEVGVQSINLFDKTLEQDWISIKQTLKLNDASIENFRVDYERDGNIKSLHYQMVGNKDGETVHYNIDLFEHNKSYKIYPSKTNQSRQSFNLISANEFFNMLTNINLKELLPKTDYPRYSIDVQGNLNNYLPTAKDHFTLLTSQGVKEISEKDPPITGVSLTLLGMAMTSDTSFSSAESRYFILSR